MLQSFYCAVLQMVFAIVSVARAMQWQIYSPINCYFCRKLKYSGENISYRLREETSWNCGY